MGDIKSMSDQELVDHGYKLKAKYDQLEDSLDAVKAEARERAKKQKKDHFFGHKNFMGVASGSATSCDPKELYETYEDLGRTEDFFNAVKVTIGTAKKDLGETIFATVSDVETFPYRNVSFKEKAPKKYHKELGYPGK